MKETLAIIASVAAMFSTLPYIIDTVRAKTRPNVVSWFTWSLLTGIAMAAAFVAHEPRTALLLLGSTVCTMAVVIIGLKYGYAKLTFFDGLCQVGAIIGLILWLIFNSPTVAIVATILIDFIAAVPTFRHSWSKPAEETWQTYMIGIIVSALTIISLTHYSINSFAFPVYLLISNSGLVAMVICRRKQKGLVLTR